MGQRATGESTAHAETATGLSGPTLSLIIASNGSAETVRRCLAELEAQREDAEVIVCEPLQSGAELRDRFSWARFIEHPNAPVPVLWSDGIAQSRGAGIALTISPMLVAPGWVQAVRSQLGLRAAVAGAIEPAAELRLRDWGEYLCRYSHDMLPFPAHLCDALPGDNSAYRRDALEAVSEEYEEGFWEPEVNRALKARGVELWHVPELVVRQGRSAGARVFMRQRLLHGAAYGAQRGARFSAARNLAGVGATPLVPVLMTFRILRSVAGHPRRRLQAVRALPFILAFNTAWAVGEARGHLSALRRR